MKTNILALDLGTKTGYAYNLGDKMFFGTWELATKKEITGWGKSRLSRRQDPRIPRLQSRISLLCSEVSVIVFEDVQFSTTTMQTQLWSSLRAAVWLSCGPNILRECVPVSTLKKFATGHGAATKENMRAAMVKLNRFDVARSDDNAIDALWLWLWEYQIMNRK